MNNKTENNNIQIAQETILILKDFIELTKTGNKLSTKTAKNSINTIITETTQSILKNAEEINRWIK